MKNISLLLSTSFLLLILGCTHTQSVSNSYTVILTSGGGFTGIYSGHHIDTSGTIISWEGRTFDMASKKVLGNLSPDKLKEMNAKITALEILNVNYKKSGNISSSISISTNNSKHTVSWVGVEPAGDVPENIKEIYYYMKNLITASITK